MYRLLIIFSFITTPVILTGQYLISSEMIGTYSQEQLELIYSQEFRTGVTLYKATYMTTGTNGETDTASGLIVLPDEALVEELPVVAYQHGTTNGPESCPSRLTAGHDIPIVYGAMGYIVSATDYLGLGDNDGFHPYVHAATQASAGLDMLIATTEFVEDTFDQPWTGPLFVSGYSQGGHAAAALQRELEKNWSIVFPVTASTPMSGPYDISGIMFEQITTDAIYFFPAYVAYVILGYQEVYGNLYDTLGDIFKPFYVAPIESFYNHEVSTFDLNFFMINQLINDHMFVIPSRMFRDSVLEILRNDTIDHPIKIALRDNDVYNWAPQSPTRLLYCEGDEQVPYQNSLVADSVMNANGAPDVMAMSMDPDEDHAGCAPLALAESIRFFDSFLLSSSVASPRMTTSIELRPNPVRQGTELLVAPRYAGCTANFYSVDGMRVQSAIVQQGGNIDITFLSEGVYVITISHDRGTSSEKVLILSN